MVNKKFLILFLALLIVGMSVAVAADVDDSTSTTKKVTKDTTKIVKNNAVTKKATKTTDKKTKTKAKENTKTKDVKNTTEKTTTKKNTQKSVKADPHVYNVNNTTFDDIFTNGILNSTLNKPTVINFTGSVSRSNSSYVINESVNVNGNGFTLDLNTIYGYGADNNPTYIEFKNGASNSNITNLKFHNTQVFTTTASNITFDNINVTVDNQGVGKGTGYFAMRNGVINITVKNSYFHAVNNTGCSAVVITLGENCTIDNNRIIGEGTVGNLIYLNLWGATNNTNGITQNKNNTISNNIIIGPDESSSICQAITIGGPHNHIINNTINYTGKGIIGNWAGTYNQTTNTTNDYYNDTYVGNGYINNTINNGASFSGAQCSLVAGNTFTGTATIAKNSTVKNNTFYESATINQYSDVTDNTFYGPVTINQYTNVTNNKFNSTIILKNNVNFKNNNAENSTVYVNGANCDLCGNRINTLVISAYPAYVCRDNIFTNYPTDPNISWYIHGSRNSNLNKNYLRSVKTSSVTEGIEYEEVDIDDEETFLKYFRFQEQGEAWLPLGTYITGNTRFKLGYFPEKGKLFYLMLPVYGQYMDSHFSIVGKNNLTLNNVGFYVVGTHCSISNLTLVYNLEDETDNTQPVSCQDFGMSGCYIEFDNLNITLNCEYGTINTVFGTTKSNNLGNIIIQNSIINVKCPASSFAVISNNAENTKILNNIINIEEKYNVGDNPYIIGIYGDVNSTLNHNSNNVTCINNIINMNGESTLIAIKIGGNTNTITNNNITVTTTGTATGVELTGNDSTVTGNALVANDVMGNDAVVDNGANNVIQDNGPMATELTVINPSVVNVNEISPMTVIFKDAKGNLLANQEINVTVGDESEIIKTDASGIAFYEFLPTNSGSVDVVFNYLGGGVFLSSNKTVTVTVNEDKDAIIEELNKTIQEQKETIASNEEDITDLNNIINEQDDEIESLTNTTQALNNTVAQLEKDLTQAQEQLANNNNTNTNGTSNTNTTTPTKTSVTLKVNPTTIYTGSKTKITATLKDANGKAVASQKISIKVGTKTYTVKTNKKGVATKTVKVTKTGKNKITATFKATKKYAKATKTATLTVKAKQATKITVTKLTYKNKKITIKATIKAGKKALTQNTKLTIKVDGKTLTAKKTSKKGKISLTLKKALKKGSHKVQIISKATSMYKQAKVSKTLKV